jgi:hypothetical protein
LTELVRLAGGGSTRVRDEFAGVASGEGARTAFDFGGSGGVHDGHGGYDVFPVFADDASHLAFCQFLPVVGGDGAFGVAACHRTSGEAHHAVRLKHGIRIAEHAEHLSRVVTRQPKLTPQVLLHVAGPRHPRITDQISVTRARKP